MAYILVAEDDMSMRHFLAMALQKAGHAVMACADGMEALHALENRGQDFELLLADIVMPGMDGIELSQRAAVLQPGIKVMFITGFAAIALGQDNESANTKKPVILSKPFHLKELVDQVENLLAA